MDNKNQFPAVIDENLRMIGTATAGCNIACGETLIAYTPRQDSLLAGIFQSVHALAPERSNNHGVETKSGEVTLPVINSARVDPVKVYPGDIMKVVVDVAAKNGVNTVSANLGGIDTINLKLASGDQFQGIWQADWQVHSTSSKFYNALVTVTDTQGQTATTTVNWSDPPLSGWIAPDIYSAPTGQWTSGQLAIDSNTMTYATNTFGSTGWGEYIYLNLNQPVLASGVRLIADYLDRDINAMQIDVFKNGAWVTVFNGGNQANWNAKWAGVTFPAGQVTQARFRWNYKSGGYYYWLYEFQFYQTTATITLPTVLTQDASLIQDVYATLHATITADGGEPCSYRFEYGLTTTYTGATDWFTGAASGDTLDDFITGLTPDTLYHFRVDAKNTFGTAYGADLSFKTKVPVVGSISPNGVDDPDGVWANGLLATDGNPSTYASSYHDNNASVWSSYLTFIQDASYTNAVSFYARGMGEVDQAEVDVLRDGTWFTAFDGKFMGMQYVTVSFTQGIVTQARIRFHAVNNSSGFFWQLNEFNFQKSSEGTAGSCIDLTELIPIYITGIPYDPQQGSNQRTYYAVKKLSDKRIEVYSCAPELGQTILVQR